MFKPLALAAVAAFAPDPRFARRGSRPVRPPEPELPLAANAELPPDPFEIAHAEGYAQGRADALAEVAAEAAAAGAARETLALSFARLETAEAERITGMLSETVEALCEALIGEVALDPKSLLRRAELAARLLSRAEDERTFRLHPEDIALVQPQLPADWKVVPDATLERGAIRIETPAGGVEDGPGNWRRAIAEAIAAC